MISIETMIFSNRADEFLAHLASREPKMICDKEQILDIVTKIDGGIRLLFSERLIIQRMIYWVIRDK